MSRRIHGTNRWAFLLYFIFFFFESFFFFQLYFCYVSQKGSKAQEIFWLNFTEECQPAINFPSMLPLHSALHERGVQDSKYSQEQHKPKCGTSVPFSALIICCFTAFLIKNTYSFKIKLIFFPHELVNESASEVFCLVVSLLDGQAINALTKMVFLSLVYLMR